MNLLIALLALILLAAVALAAELLRKAHVADATTCAELWAGVSAQRDYRPLERLFDQTDFDLVEGRPAILSRLRGGRRRATRLFLRQLRRDFLQAWALCRILSPISPDPGLAVRLAWHWLAFHGVYAAATVRLGYGINVVSVGTLDPRGLAPAVRALRKGAAELVQTQERLGHSTAGL